MKSIISCILSCALFLNSCAWYFPLSEADRAEGKLDPDKYVKLTLVNGSTIECKPYRYLEVSKPSDFIYGIGVQFEPIKNRKSRFSGALPYLSIDSTTTGLADDGQRQLVCWLSDGTRVRFNEGNYVIVRSDQGIAFWCAGVVREGDSEEAFKGRIPSDQVQQIQVQKLRETSRSLVTLGFIGIGVYLLVMVILSREWNWRWGD